MKHCSKFQQTNTEEVERLIQSLSMCVLTTFDDGKKETGVFTPVYIDGVFYLHLNKTDNQFKALKRSLKGELLFFDFLCNIPSYWVDKLDGGVATSYYRFAEFNCEVRAFDDVATLAHKMDIFLKKHQSEGGYVPITAESSIYKKSLLMLELVEMRPIETITKWKLGQNRSVEKRLEIIENLKLRNHKEDLRAAQEVERWIGMNQ